MAIDDLRKCTLPSANRKLAPPGWLLVAFRYCPSEASKFGLLRATAHQANGHWVEVGGTTVLNMPKPPSSSAHRKPFTLYAPGPRLFWAANPAMQALRSAMTPV